MQVIDNFIENCFLERILNSELLGGWQWAFLLRAPGPAIGTAAMLALRRMPEAARLAHGRR